MHITGTRIRDVEAKKDARNAEVQSTKRLVQCNFAPFSLYHVSHAVAIVVSRLPSQPFAMRCALELQPNDIETTNLNFTRIPLFTLANDLLHFLFTFFGQWIWMRTEWAVISQNESISQIGMENNWIDASSNVYHIMPFDFSKFEKKKQKIINNLAIWLGIISSSMWEFVCVCAVCVCVCVHKRIFKRISYCFGLNRFAKDNGAKCEWCESNVNRKYFADRNESFLSIYVIFDLQNSFHSSNAKQNIFLSFRRRRRRRRL